MSQIQEIPVEYILQDEYEIDETKEYTLDTLKLGMRVHTGQLKNIYYTYILLANPILIELGNNTTELAGTIVYIGDNQNKELLKAWDKYTIKNRRPCKVYNIEDFESDQFICPPHGMEDCK